MGVLERREREREEVRRKILDAARDLFATEGYDRVTMRRVADAIEYSPTALYHHFEDKEDLVRSLCEEDFARLLSHLQQEPPPASPIAHLRQLGRAYENFAVSLPNHYRFLFMTPNKFEDPLDCTRPGDQAFSVLKSACERALSAGELEAPSAQLLAQVLWASLHGAVSLLITLKGEHWPEGGPDPGFVGEVVENAIRGFRPAGR